MIEHVERRRDRVRHRAEVDRNVSRLGHEPSLALEERAGEVPPLLDVWRIAAAGQHCSHFLGNSGQRAPEQFQGNGINGCFITHRPVLPCLYAWR